MEVKIKAIHFDISDRLTEFINKKAERLVRLYPDIATVDVSLKVVKPETAMNKGATLSVTIPGHDAMVAGKTADTFEEAIDLCLDAIKRQSDKKKAQH